MKDLDSARTTWANITETSFDYGWWRLSWLSTNVGEVDQGCGELFSFGTFGKTATGGQWIAMNRGRLVDKV